MRFIGIFFFCTLAYSGQAHPSWGITVDKNGEIYFVDILHNNGTLWRIDQQGQLFEVITNFHAHDLHLDHKSNLWLAENLWVEGEIEGEGQHSLIKLNATQEIDTILVTLDQDIFSGTNFTIGPNQKIYFTNDGKVYQYLDGHAEILFNHKFKNVKNMIMDANGILWITDSNVNNGTLYQYKPSGKLKVFATQLMPQDPSYPLFEEKHLQFLIGIAKDNEGNIYVSENAGCSIIKINPLGEKSTFYQSPTLWSPMNVAFHNGDAYIMEAGFNKGNRGPRIIKKSKSGAISRLVNVETIPDQEVQKIDFDQEGFSIPSWVYFGLSFLVFGLIIILSVKKQHSIEQ